MLEFRMFCFSFLISFFLLPWSSRYKDVHAVVTFNGMLTGSEEGINADVSLIENRHQSTDSGFPPDIVLRITSVDVACDIILTRNIDLSDNVPIFLQRTEGVKGYKINSDKAVAYYNNLTTGASFMVWGADKTLNQVEEQSFTYFGTFPVDGNVFHVQPKTRGHSVTKMKDSLPLHTDFISTAENEIKYSPSQTINTGSTIHKRQTKNYQVEAFFVVDYAVYQFWFEKTSGTITERQTATLNRIRQYYAFVLNGVNLSYRSVTRRGYTITCLFAGLYIADTPCAAPFVNDNLYYGPGGLALDADKALYAFKEWAETSLVFHYDHAFLFSGYNLTRFVDTEEGDFAGLGFRPGLCSDYKYSINEDKDFISYVVKTASHELGHNLGAYHDGETNFCSFDDNFIMGAPTSAGDRLYRRWIFSNCSLDAFDQYIQKMETGEYNCMTSLNADYTGINLKPYANDLPGQVYPPDKQCEYMFGPGSFLARTFYNGNYSVICTRMTCGTQEEKYQSEVPWDGTTCGSHKICEAGFCVNSSAAPTIENEQCMFGDTPYNVMYQNQTCSEYLGATSDAYRCYSNVSRYSCCATCQRHRDHFGAVQDCEYGDKNPDCATIPLNWCYKKSNMDICCKRCRDDIIDIPGCEYGDRSSWCATMPLDGCSLQSNAELCCFRCSGRASDSSNMTTTVNPTKQATSAPIFTKSTTTVSRMELVKCPKMTTLNPKVTTRTSTTKVTTSTATSRASLSSVQTTSTFRQSTTVVNNIGGISGTTTVGHKTTAANETLTSGTTRVNGNDRFQLRIATVVLFLLCIYRWEYTVWTRIV